MKTTRQFLHLCLIVLSLAFLLTMVACTTDPAPDREGDESPTPGQTTEVTFSLTEADGSSRYTVVYPEYKGADAVKGAAENVRDALATALGKQAADISLQADSAAAVTYEILIGETDRQESATATEALGETEYIICVDGEKIVIAGGSPTAICAAATVFADTYLADPATVTSTLSVTGQCELVIDGPHLVRTLYPTEDTVVADIMPYEMGYDVDPTGTKDSTAGIQKALDDCANLGGGTVFLSAGHYRLTGTVTVPSFVTLRGDWQDPDTGNEYGTVIVADVTENIGPMIAAAQSAGVRGLTFYYPHQSAENPIDLGWAIESARDGTQCPNILDITLINAYNGVGLSQPPHQWTATSNGWFYNIKGTALNIGFAVYNNSGACSYEKMHFSPNYWLAAGEKYNAPDENTLKKYLRENATGIVLGDLEMPLVYKLEVDGYHYGIHIADGDKRKFWGSGMAELNVTDCDVALFIEEHWEGRMTGIVRSTLMGSEASIIMGEKASKSTVLVTDCVLSHEPQGVTMIVDNSGDSEKAYEAFTGTAHATGREFVNVTLAPYNCPMQPINYEGNFGTEDATPAIQAALDHVGNAGGGVVYLPAGYYRIEGYLTIPAGVELRGAGAIPYAPSYLGGTNLMIYSGKEPDDPYTAQATITVVGEGAGLRDLQFFYPENPFADPSKHETLVPFSYTIRLDAVDAFIENTFFSNPYLAIDITENADNHYIKRLGGTAALNMIRVGACSGGWIESLHDINPTYWMQGNDRHRMGVDWMWKDDLGAFMGFQQANCDLIVIEGTDCEYILDILQFGGGELIVVNDDGYAIAWNVSIDQGGYSCVTVNDGYFIGMNVQRTYSGPNGDIVIRGDGDTWIYNEFHLY
ncbi:MAG: hypothetical protein IJW40_06670 [Clostridia bacterium]|nr:hypothetical protein [Clostridia bacterium]